MNFDSPQRVAALLAVAAGLSYLGALLGGALILRPEMAWPLWPGCVILVFQLLLVPKKLWPFVLVAGFSAFIFYDLRASVPVRSTILLILADTVEVLIASWGLLYVFEGVPRLNSIKALVKYSFCAVLVAPLLGTSIGAFAMNGNYLLHWRIGFFSEALAFLTLMPAILTWYLGARDWANRPLPEHLEAAALLAGLGILGYITFTALDGNVPPALLYALLPFLLWAALRFAVVGVTSAVLIIAFQSIWGVIHGHGPFIRPGPLQGIVSLQLFLVVVSIPFLALAMMVEERKLAVAALRESEQRFRLVANTAPVMIWMSGPALQRNYFNEPWLKFTGRSLESEVGGGWRAGIHGEDAKACLDAYAQAYKRREPFHRQYRLRRRDGEYRWVLDMGVPRFEADGEFAGFIGSCIDVTDRKLAEEALSGLSRKLIEAQETERARIARELHDDISQRLALLGINMEQLNLHLPASFGDFKERLHQFCDAASEIARDVHAISHRLHSSKLDFLGIATAAASYCAELAQQQAVVIHFRQSDVPAHLPKETALCLFRVLQEALQNAVKHSGSEDFFVELHGFAGVIELTVSDHGRGFDVNAAKMGHGLGLVSMRERVHLVHGDFAIESRPNGGTTVRARAPLRPKEAVPDEKASAAAS